MSYSPHTLFTLSRYDLMMTAFGGLGLRCSTVLELEAAFQTVLCGEAIIPALIDIVLDPMAGVESGNVHAFNVPQKAKL